LKDETMRMTLFAMLLISIAQAVQASDPPPAPQSDIPTVDGKPILPSDAVLPPPPSPDLPSPGTPPPPGAKLEAPPAPPAPKWIIHSFRWIGNQWVKQPDHCLKTTDLKQAAAYCLELSRFQDWYYQTNVPLACCDPAVKPSAIVPNSAPTPDDFPHLSLSVWAYKFTNGKWVKDEKYSWSPKEYYSMRADLLAYARKLNAIPGWCATTNSPDWVNGKPRPAAPPAPPAPDGK
jgi:hypothetical protein